MNGDPDQQDEDFDKQRIFALQSYGYTVVVADINGKTFAERYDVFQDKNCTKSIVTSSNGRIVGLQG